MEVCIDSKEQSRAERAEESYNKMGCKASIKRLIIGDYLFDNEVVFEYKTYADCFSSIIDGRLFNQALDQFENYPYHFVIIVGTEGEKMKALNDLYYNKVRFSITQYEGMMASLNTFTTVLFAETEAKAFHKMKLQAVKCLDNKPLVKKSTKKSPNTALTYLSLIKGIGLKKAIAIVERGQINTLEELLCLDTKWLMEVEGIGKNTAELIVKNIKTNEGAIT